MVVMEEELHPLWNSAGILTTLHKYRNIVQQLDKKYQLSSREKMMLRSVYNELIHELMNIETSTAITVTHPERLHSE